MKNILSLAMAPSLLTQVKGVMCPSKPFPMMIGAPNGDTKLTCIFQDDDLFYVGGTSSAPSMNGNSPGVFKAIYHTY